MPLQTTENIRPPIFVIDDEADVGRGLRMLLRVSGYAVTTFLSAEAFLATLDGSTSLGDWHCGLVDVQLPGKSGLDLVADLRGRGAPPPGLLLMTGHVTEEVERRTAQAGLPKILAKPLDPIAVLEAVRQSPAA